MVPHRFRNLTVHRVTCNAVLDMLGSPVGAVGLALRAVNEVKLDWARLELGWEAR